MSQPIEPTVNPMAPPVSSVAPGEALLEQEIRLLAGELGVHKTVALSGRKAKVASVSLGDASTAPTIGVTLDGVSVTGVRLAASYSPQVGDTVMLLKQNDSLFAAFKIQDRGTAVQHSTDGGFTKVTFNSGHSHNANDGGDVMYRRVLDNGAWKMQWQGALNLGGSDTILSGGNALDTDFRPKSRRTIVCARDATDTVVVKLDFNTDGSVTIVGPTVSPSTSGSPSSTGSAQTISTVSHSHGGAVSSSQITHNDGFHSHGMSHSHSTTVVRPWYVSLNGVEYFL